MRCFLNVLLICFCLQLSAVAAPNYTYTLPDGSTNKSNGAPVITDWDKRPIGQSFWYDGTYFYDVSKAAAKKQQIVDDYFKSHKISETAVIIQTVLHTQ